MKAKQVVLLATLLTLSLALLFSGAFAQAPEKQQKRVKARIELTQEQKEKIRDTRLDFQKQNIRLKADLKIARLELQSLMADEEADKAKIYQKIEEIGALRTRLAKNRVDQKMAIRDILTKEQRDKLKELKFRKAGRKRLLEKGMQGRRHRPARSPLFEIPRLRGEIPYLPPDYEGAHLAQLYEFLFEAPELAEEAELVQILDELQLAEPVPLIEETELLPLLEEIPPLPEEEN
jgi:Spy/CpxP family protein refolding chaperone